MNTRMEGNVLQVHLLRMHLPSECTPQSGLCTRFRFRLSRVAACGFDVVLCAVYFQNDCGHCFCLIRADVLMASMLCAGLRFACERRNQVQHF